MITKVSTRVNFMQILLFSHLLVFCQCSKEETELTNETGGTNIYAETLQEIASFPIGTAVSTSRLSNSASKQIILDEFNSITCESAMKIKNTQVDATTFDFAEADSLVNFAIRNGKRVHGHTLVWGKQIPEWIENTNFEGDSADWEMLLKNRIQTMITHFKGRVRSWDVVNEAIEEDGTFRKYANDEYPKENIWCQKLGEGYVARSFQYAREADPDILLFYNDYGMEYNSVKLDAILNMVANFKKKGIPIDGIGIQMHTHCESTSDLEKAFENLASSELLIHISELDVAINRSQTINAPTNSLLGSQKEYYRRVAESVKVIPASQMFGISLWGFSDAITWKENDWPHLWDKEYVKKPAYYGFWEGLK